MGADRVPRRGWDGAGEQFVCRWYWWDIFEYEDDCYHVFEAIRLFQRGYRSERVPYWEWDKLSYHQQNMRREMFIDKTRPSNNGRRGIWEGEDAKWAEKHPAIWEYMTKTEYGDGSERVVSTVSMFVGQEGCTVVLQDRDVKRSLWACGPTWEQAFKVLEQQLQKGSKAPWRADKRDTGGTGRLDRRPG